MHVRQQIHNALKTAVTGLTTTGTRVTDDPADPVLADASPSLLVLHREDVPNYGEAAEMAGACIVDRTLTANLQGYASTLADLNLIAEQVEAALFTDPTFGGLAVGTQLGTQTIAFDTGGETAAGLIDMRFEITYRVAEGTPGTAVT